MFDGAAYAWRNLSNLKLYRWLGCTYSSTMLGTTWHLMCVSTVSCICRCISRAVCLVDVRALFWFILSSTVVHYIVAQSYNLVTNLIAVVQLSVGFFLRELYEFVLRFRATVISSWMCFREEHYYTSKCIFLFKPCFFLYNLAERELFPTRKNAMYQYCTIWYITHGVYWT